MILKVALKQSSTRMLMLQTRNIDRRKHFLNMLSIKKCGLLLKQCVICVDPVSGDRNSPPSVDGGSVVKDKPPRELSLPIITTAMRFLVPMQRYGTVVVKLVLRCEGCMRAPIDRP